MKKDSRPTIVWCMMHDDAAAIHVTHGGGNSSIEEQTKVLTPSLLIMYVCM